MSRHQCPSCGWSLLGDDRPNLLAACPECGQVVHVPGFPTSAIPHCGTDALIDWGEEVNPQEVDFFPLVPPEFCFPMGARHLKRSGREHAVHGFFFIGLSIFLALAAWQLNALESQPRLLFFICAGGLSLLAGIHLLYRGFRKFRRCTRARLLSMTRLPYRAKYLGIPFALHCNRDRTPALLFAVGVLYLAGAAVCALLLLIGAIQDGRMATAAVACLLAGAASFYGAARYRRLRLLVYPDGFVVLRGRDPGELWRWDEIESIHLNTQESLAGLLSFTLRGKDGATFSFDYHLEYIENQFGARVQHTLIRQLFPSLLHRARAGEQVEFGSLSVSGKGLHHQGRCVPWQQVANITLDRAELTFGKWGGDRGAASWSVPHSAIPNGAVFLALIQQFMDECSHAGQSALSVLMDRSNSLDPTAIQAQTENLQAPVPLEIVGKPSRARSAAE